MPEVSNADERQGIKRMEIAISPRLGLYHDGRVHIYSIYKMSMSNVIWVTHSILGLENLKDLPASLLGQFD